MKASDITVQELLTGIKKTFIIPPFQRNYAWVNDQCRELYNDVRQSAVIGGSHYLGNVVYYLGENSNSTFQEIILIDGQQRITTILLLLCALRDVTDDENLKKDINELYLRNDRAPELYRIRLKHTVADDESFTAIVNDEGGSDTKGNVFKNYDFFKRELLKLEKDSHLSILDAVVRMQLVDVKLDVGKDTKNRLHLVQTIFEKINSTGKPLSQADLIRNILLVSETDEKQRKWHNDYWLKIEKHLGVDNISAFARDFLRMTDCEEIRESDTYREFKSYLNEDMKGNQEAVLKILLRFSKVYAWLIHMDCPDEALNRELTMLRNLKSNDFTPLALYLLDRLYDDSLSELQRIIHLLVDYIIRLRIASPTTGSGATRSLSFELVRKMRDEGDDAIACTYDAILFELSNSPIVANEFPTDEKFISALQGTFYHVYARELLLRVEEYETKWSIPVDISKVTVEHLMPQTLSDWWKQNLGGNDEAERIRIGYTNTVGNFAIVSQGYNSSMSNKPWHEKREKLREVQFNVTSAVAKEEQWNELTIQKRGADLATRAAKAIISPLIRTRDYRSRTVSEAVTGIYPLLQSDDTLTGTYINAVIYNEERKECSTWSRLLSVVGDFLYSENPSLFIEAIRGEDIWFSRDSSQFKKSFQIAGSPWFCCGGGCDGKQFRNVAARVSEKMGCQEYIQLEVVNPRGDD